MNFVRDKRPVKPFQLNMCAFFGTGKILFLVFSFMLITGTPVFSKALDKYRVPGDSTGRSGALDRYSVPGIVTSPKGKSPVVAQSVYDRFEETVETYSPEQRKQARLAFIEKLIRASSYDEVKHYQKLIFIIDGASNKQGKAPPPSTKTNSENDYRGVKIKGGGTNPFSE